MNVLIICAAGMSSSSLCDKVRNKIKEEHIENIKIGSCGTSQVNKYAIQADLILVAPQISYLKEKIDSYGYTKALVMPQRAYGLQDISVILDMIQNPMKYEQPEQRKQSTATKIAQTIGANSTLQILTTALQAIFPISFIGSIFTVVVSFPVSGWTDFISGTLFEEYLNIGIDMTNGLITLYLAVMIAHFAAVEHGQRKTGVILSTIVDLFLLNNVFENGYLDISCFGARGLFFGIFVAVGTYHLYFATVNHLYHSKIPYLEDVDLEVFSAIIPTLVCIFVSFGLSFGAEFLFEENLVELVNNKLILFMSDIIGTSWISYLLMQAIVAVLWFLGIHGGKIISTVRDPIYASFSLQNLEAWRTGQSLPYIAVNQFSNAYMFGGVGSTLALAFLMAFFSKSKKMKELGKLSLPMGIFFINEPIIFGLPYVLNFPLLLPFIGIPFVSGFLTAVLMSFGILPYCNGISIPWTTPPIISGFIEGGWQLALWQGILLILQALMWYPVFRQLDQKELQLEKK